MTAAVETILRKIDALKPKDRLALERQLARRIELQWKKEVVGIRRRARQQKIDQADIDTTLSKLRYSK